VFLATMTAGTIGALLLSVLLGSTSLVWRWFFLPPVILFVAGALWGARERRLTPQ
jgi:hypothetical protein